MISKKLLSRLGYATIYDYYNVIIKCYEQGDRKKADKLKSGLSTEQQRELHKIIVAIVKKLEYKRKPHINAGVQKARIVREQITKKPIKHYLKPWKDPESLFCNKKALETFMRKEIATGKECKDNQK